jgi:hypothetical protein
LAVGGISGDLPFYGSAQPSRKSNLSVRIYLCYLCS